jgi:hypothetical protein
VLKTPASFSVSGKCSHSLQANRGKRKEVTQASLQRLVRLFRASERTVQCRPITV